MRLDEVKWDKTSTLIIIHMLADLFINAMLLTPCL